nr:YfiR family protein [uncultured Noviherbaspirillum sp.]
MDRRRLLRLAPALLGLAWSAAGGQDISPAVLQNQVMAASLFRFLPYVEWPAAVLPPGAPYVIAVIGADAIADELATVVASRTVNGRTVSVRRMKAGESMEGMHAVFVGAGARRLPPRGRHVPVLVVTEAEGALDQGSMINFRVVDGRVRFEVALDTLEEAGLKVSSRMLGVALHVRTAPSR